MWSNRGKSRSKDRFCHHNKRLIQMDKQYKNLIKKEKSLEKDTKNILSKDKARDKMVKKGKKAMKKGC
jgi:hypothetical protein